MHDVNTVYIALGSNLGNRSANINAALEAIKRLEGTALMQMSDVLETDPVGPPGQGKYLNAVAEISTSLRPHGLIESCLDIERTLGRVRDANARWTERTIDIDILLFGSEIIAEPGLCVPHPRLAEREFVLRPLAQIAPQVVHPQLKTTVQTLLDELVMGKAGDFSPPQGYCQEPAKP